MNRRRQEVRQGKARSGWMASLSNAGKVILCCSFMGLAVAVTFYTEDFFLNNIGTAFFLVSVVLLSNASSEELNNDYKQN